MNLPRHSAEKQSPSGVRVTSRLTLTWQPTDDQLSHKIYTMHKKVIHCEQESVDMAHWRIKVDLISEYQIVPKENI